MLTSSPVLFEVVCASVTPTRVGNDHATDADELSGVNQGCEEALPGKSDVECRP